MKNKFWLTLAVVLALGGVGYAITVNPASNVTGDSAATPETVVYRDANAAFDAGSLSNSLQASGIDTWSRTKAQFSAMTPSRVGQIYYCSDCAVKNICISTGTGISAFMRADLSTAGCGVDN